MLLRKTPPTSSAASRGSALGYEPVIARRWPGRWHSVAVFAAKKGGDKKGPKKSKLAELMKKKEEAATAGHSAQPAQYDTPEARMLAFQMCDSYWRLTKKYLLEGLDFNQLPAALYRAPFVLLAHNRFQAGVTDPIFMYGNRAALQLFEASWDELLQMPSRKSAADEPVVQKDRNGLLDQAALTGLVTNYEGWRVSKNGRRFKIKDATLFNIMDRQGTRLGQAAVFSRYELEDGREVEITAAPEEEGGGEAEGDEGLVGGLPSPEMVQAAEVAVTEQATHVRGLKEQQGLTNQDITVQLAVYELKKRKETLAGLQKKLDDALAASKALFDDEDE